MCSVYGMYVEGCRYEGRIAQSVEHGANNARVLGSSPSMTNLLPFCHTISPQSSPHQHTTSSKKSPDPHSHQHHSNDPKYTKHYTNNARDDSLQRFSHYVVICTLLRTIPVLRSFDQLDGCLVFWLLNSSQPSARKARTGIWDPPDHSPDSPTTAAQASLWLSEIPHSYGPLG